MTFKKGEVTNPKGRPPGYQSFVDRAKYWLESHTAEEIIKLMETPEKAKKLGAYDYMILHRIVEAFTIGGRQSMDGLLDRLLGKPQQTVKQEIDATIQHKGLSHTSEWLAEVLGTGPAIALKEPVSH